MKKRYFALGAAILVCGVMLAGFGAFLRESLPEENAFLYEDHSLIALPFGLLADGRLDDVLAGAVVDGTATSEATDGTVVDPLPDDTETSVVTDVTTQPVSESETIDDQTQDTTAPQDTTIPSASSGETTAPPTEPDVTEPSVSLEELYPVVPEPVVGPEYFDDALFIGDSRVCGLRDYARLGDADYFCDVGMTIFNIWETKCYDYDFYLTLLSDHLQRVKYGKLYVALGINECGFPTENFMSEYQRMIKKLRELQPDATIVLQGIMSVTRGYARSLPYFQPDHIAMLNEFIASLADGEQIFYIDPNEVFTDPEGFLLMSITKDGCHLYAKEHPLWSQWLQSCPPIS